MADTRRSVSALQALLADNTSGDISAQDARDTMLSEHPEKTHQTAAVGSEPSGPLTGDVFLPNNGVYLQRYSGSAWVPWGPIFPMTAPVDASFAWINQGGASVDTTYGGIYLAVPAAAGVNWRIRKLAAPSTPYTITACFLLDTFGADNAYIALGWRESSSSKIVTFGLQMNTGSRLKVDKWTNETTFSATYIDFIARSGSSSCAWLRITDNGTNRICSVSSDGQHWIAVHTVGRTDFLTANEVLFGGQSQNGTYDAGFSLLSWKQT